MALRILSPILSAAVWLISWTFRPAEGRLIRKGLHHATKG